MADPISAPDPVHLRAELAAIVGALADGPRVPYIYGGITPEGMDCSGLVIWGCRQLSTPFDIGRPTADWFWDHLEHVAEADAEPGDLACYGGGDAHHVVVCLPAGRVASMSGGSPACTTAAYALAHHAWLRVYDSPRYRTDLLGFRRVDFSKTPGVG
jgi:cell wall-associated NlpC family hydrolase